MADLKVDSIANSAGTGAVTFPFGFSQAISTLPDADTSVTSASTAFLVTVPSANRIYTLNSSFGAAAALEIFNDQVVTSFFTATIKANNGDTICTLWPGMRCKVVSLQASPGTGAHWDQQLPLVSPIIPSANLSTWTANISIFQNDFSRQGPNLFLAAKFQLTGAPSATSLSTSLPPGLALPSGGPGNAVDYSSQNMSCGSSYLVDAGNASYNGQTVSNGTTNILIISSNGQAVDQNTPFVWGSGDNGSYSISIPIQGWSNSRG